MRHADCREISILIEIGKHFIHLEIKDDGRGFEPENAGDGNGLGNIRFRAEALNADWNLESAPGKGTRWAMTFKI